MTDASAKSAVENKVVLQLRNITVSFDGYKALNDLSLSIYQGELRCLIGPNGAGKTTLMDVVTGRTRADSGALQFEDNPVDLGRMSEAQIAQIGISRKFQKPTVFEQLSVTANLALALASDRGVWVNLFAKPDTASKPRINELLHLTALEPFADQPAGRLSHGQKQWLEMGMLLAQNPKVLLVDEPIAGMTEQEAQRTGELLTSLAGDCSVVVVEHDMAFVRSIARTVTVLHEGSVLAEGSMQEMQQNSAVSEVYLGT